MNTASSPSERYRDLLRFAYLCLGRRGDDHARVARARRIVRRRVRWWIPLEKPDHDYAALRRRVLDSVLATRGVPPSSAAAGEDAPEAATGDDGADLLTVLDALDVGDRVAYVLQRVEGLSAEHVAAELRGRDDCAAKVDERTGLSAERQRELLTGAHVDALLARPALAVEARRARRFLLRVGAVAVVVALLVGSALGYWVWRTPPDPAVMSVDESLQSGSISLAAWPVQGNLRDDMGLLRRAQRKWLARANDAGPEVHVLYAAETEAGWARVLLFRSGHLAVYGEDDDDSYLNVFPVPAGQGVLALQDSEGQVRFLVPPWVKQLEVAPIRGGTPRWRSLRVRAGVSDPVHLGEPCGAGVLVRATHPSDDVGEAATFVYWRLPRRAEMPYMPYPAALSVVKYDDEIADRTRSPQAIDAPSAQRQIRGLPCGGPADHERGPLKSVVVREFWHGQVPWQDEPASAGLVIRHYMRDDTSLVRIATDRRTMTDIQLILGDVGTSGDGSLLLARYDDEVTPRTAAEWYQDESGRYWFVAVGGPKVDRIRLFGAPGPALGHGRLRAVRGPLAKDDEDPPDLPNIAVVAYDKRGNIIDALTG